MAKAIITFTIMPETPEINLDNIKDKALEMIKETIGETETKINIKPIAFGLKAIDILFVMEEDLGSPDPLAEKITEIEGIQSCEVTDVRRALG